MPKVTIVIAAYNAERWLARTLDSVLAQTLTDWRCHLVDDGSTDATVPIVEGYAERDPRFSLVRQANAGVSAARNRVLAETVDDGPYVAVLDSDDLWLPDALELMVGALDADPAAVGVQSLAEYIDEDDTPIRAGEHPAIQRRKFAVRGNRVVPAAFGPGMTFDEMIVTSGLYPPASMLFRRSALEAAGRYDESYRSQVDWEMYLRMVRGGHFAELDRQTAWYRLRAENLTGDRSTVALNQARLRRKAWEESPPGSSQRRAAEVAYRHTQRGKAMYHARQLKGAAVGRRVGGVVSNAALTGYFAVHAVARRPVRPNAGLTRRVSRAQSRLWAAESARRTPDPRDGGPGP